MRAYSADFQSISNQSPRQIPCSPGNSCDLPWRQVVADLCPRLLTRPIADEKRKSRRMPANDAAEPFRKLSSPFFARMDHSGHRTTMRFGTLAHLLGLRSRGEDGAATGALAETVCRRL